MTSPREPAAPISEELLPCPFCGGEASYSTGRKGEIPFPYVECNDCSAMSDGECGWTRSQAAELWNTRAAPRSPADAQPRRDPAHAAAVRLADCCVAWDADSMMKRSDYQRLLDAYRAARSAPGAQEEGGDPVRRRLLFALTTLIGDGRYLDCRDFIDALDAYLDERARSGGQR